MTIITLVSRTEFLSLKNRCSGDFPFSFLFITPSLTLPLSPSVNTQHRKQSHLLTKSAPRGGTRLKTRLPFTENPPFRCKEVTATHFNKNVCFSFKLAYDVLCMKEKFIHLNCSWTCVLGQKRARTGVQSLQSCPTLCNPMDCSPPGSSVHGILQARRLEWVAMLFSRGSSQPRNQTCISYVCCIGRQVLSLPRAPSGKPSVKDTGTLLEALTRGFPP